MPPISSPGSASSANKAVSPGRMRPDPRMLIRMSSIRGVPSSKSPSNVALYVKK